MIGSRARGSLDAPWAQLLWRKKRAFIYIIARCLPACFEPQTLLALLSPWGAGLGQEQPVCSCHPPKGLGGSGGGLEGSVPDRPRGPGGPQHGVWAGKETPGPQGPSPGLRPPGRPSLQASSLQAQQGLEGECLLAPPSDVGTWPCEGLGARGPLAP